MNAVKSGRARRATAVVGGLVGLAIGISAQPASAYPLADANPAAPATFADLSTSELWRLIDDGADRAIVGLKDDDEAAGFLDGYGQLDAAERAEADASVRGLKGVSVVSADTVFPTVTVKLDGIGALRALRASRHVEFVEPAKFYGEVFSDSGCSGNSGNGNSAGGDLYTDPSGFDTEVLETSYSGPFHDTTPEGDLVPYNFKFSQVRKAWGRSPAGNGVTVAVVDTGIFPTQTQLIPASSGGRFNVLESSNRTLQAIDTTPTSGSAFNVDVCNHGTRSVGTIAGPRDGQGMVGVAYRANVLSVKVDNDVVIGVFDSEAAQVATGIRLASDAGARIISVAMGTHIEYTSIRQAIDYAYARGGLIIAAAGTGVCSVPLTGERLPVTWPARLPNVMAVTALRADGTRDPSACDGPEVDIAATITGASAPGRYVGNVLSWGGTSGATSVVSGTAALVWSKYPSWTRDQVWQRLVWARNTPTGPVNAYKAVGGLYSFNVSAPSVVYPGTSYTMSAQPQGDGPFAYLWSTGATTQSITATAGASGTSQTFWVQVRDTVDNRVITHQFSVDSVGDDTDPPCPNPRFC